MKWFEACESFPEGCPGENFQSGVKSLMPLKHSLSGGVAYLSEKSRGQCYHCYDFWPMIVSIYAAGNLSHEEDKIVAISGLATRFKWLLQDTEYLAGFWKRNLVHQIL
jgi:hypothetical protein